MFALIFVEQISHTPCKMATDYMQAAGQPGNTLEMICTAEVTPYSTVLLQVQDVSLEYCASTLCAERTTSS